MKKLTEENLKSLSDTRDIVRKEVHLPVARPAGWHNPLRNSNPDSGRIARHLDLNYRTKPQRIKDFIYRCLSVFR